MLYGNSNEKFPRNNFADGWLIRKVPARNAVLELGFESSIGRLYKSTSMENGFIRMAAAEA